MMRTVDLPRAGVIALVPDEWGMHWMGRHDTLTRLARHFPTVWVNPARGWREAWLPSHAAAAPHSEPGPDTPNFLVYEASRWLPRIHRPSTAARFLERRRLLRARRLLRDRGCKQIVLYLWRPEFAPALDLLLHDVSCYAIEDEYTFSAVGLPIDPLEAALIARVDQVFISSKAMFERKGSINRHTLCVPNGVDYAAYTAPTEEPSDLRGIPHPRIGYIGWIKEQLDLPLVLTLARRHPAWSFVLVGPTRASGEDAIILEALRHLPNVDVLGVRPHSVLPAYFQHVDVTIMPYRLTGYTEYIDPMKLPQGLATGRPVVSAPIRAAKSFPDVVAIAATPDEWSAAIESALAPSAMSPSRISARRAVAKAHDWDGLVDRIAREISARLASC